MSSDFTPTVYILASQRNGTLYTGVTSKPISRWYQHRTDQVAGFTSDYGVKLLVWFERRPTMESAILREANQEMAAMGRSQVTACLGGKRPFNR